MNNQPIIWQPCNIYSSAKLGFRVSVGMFTEIGTDVVVGDDTRIGAQCFIPEGVTIGRACFISPSVRFTNDKFPPSPRDKWERTVIEDGASIGTGTVVLCGVTIGKNSLVGCGSVVTKSIPPNEIWAGVPAKRLRKKP